MKDKLLEAAEEVWAAYLKYGPLDNPDWEPGKKLEEAIQSLRDTALEYKYGGGESVIRLRCRRTPGGRGRNAVRWEGTVGDWSESVTGTELSVIGSLTKTICEGSDGPQKISIVYEECQT